MRPITQGLTSACRMRYFVAIEAGHGLTPYDPPVPKAAG